MPTQMRIRDLGETNWQEFMKTNPGFAPGDVFIFRSKGKDYDGYTVAVYELYEPMAGDICRKGIFWEKGHAFSFASSLVEQGAAT